MHRLDLISRPRHDHGRKHHRSAFAASFLFHGLALSFVALLACFYHKLPPLSSGSAAGATSISLTKMIVVSSPAEPPPVQVPTPPVTTPILTATTPPLDPGTSPSHPQIGVPVLSMQPTKPSDAIPAKTRTANSPTHATGHSAAKPAAATAVSSYAAGASVLPHPPYPSEARDRGQTGTVVMNVRFDERGGVVLAEVAQSSGVPVLDAETRSFIRANWHSAQFAGQDISVPVQYTLQNL